MKCLLKHTSRLLHQNNAQQMNSEMLTYNFIPKHKTCDLHVIFSFTGKLRKLLGKQPLTGSFPINLLPLKNQISMQFPKLRCAFLSKNLGFQSLLGSLGSKNSKFAPAKAEFPASLGSTSSLERLELYFHQLETPPRFNIPRNLQRCDPRTNGPRKNLSIS